MYEPTNIFFFNTDLLEAVEIVHGLAGCGSDDQESCQLKKHNLALGSLISNVTTVHRCSTGDRPEIAPSVGTTVVSGNYHPG